jgi:hypothetical protein
VPDTNRINQPPSVDPRHSVANDYLEAARAKLAEQEAKLPKSRRRRADGSKRGAGFALTVSPEAFLHVFTAMIGLTLMFLAFALTYHMLHVNFTVGRVVATGTGFLTAAIAGYISVCFLAVIESTSAGETNIVLTDVDWKDWFWTLPSTLGMVGLSAALGWIVGLVLPVSVWWPIGISIFFTYPIFQLSTLETASPLAPYSPPILRSIARHPLHWLGLYGISLVMAGILYGILAFAWRDPPYATMLVMGPITTAAIFIYAWLLGQLAHFFITAEEE